MESNKTSFDRCHIDGLAIVEVRGEVDISNAERFREAIDGVRARGQLVVDLTQCRYMDSSALAVLIALYKIRGGRAIIVVAPARSNPRRLFSVAGVDRIFELYESIDEIDKPPPAA